MPTIYIEGLDKLNKKLKHNVTLDDVKRVVRENGAELVQKAQDKADFKGHWEGNRFVPPTGRLKGSISLKYPVDDGLTAVVYTPVEYAEYVERGTRFMDAQPYMKPAYDVQKEIFKRDMKLLTK